MKEIVIFILVNFLYCTISHAQNTNPLVIKGKFQNCPVKQLEVFIDTDPVIFETDTIYINDDGSFYFKTYKLDKPLMVDIRKNNFQINNLLVAPGYELHLEANADSEESFRSSLAVSGKGSEVNQFYLRIPPVSYDAYSSALWGDEPEFVEIVNKMKSDQDSFFLNMQFDSTDVHTDYFKKIIELNQRYAPVCQFMDYCRLNEYSYSQTLEFLQSYMNMNLLSDFNDNHLVAGNFKMLVSFYYPNWRLMEDREIDAQMDFEYYSLGKLNVLYKGMVEEYTMMHRIIRIIWAAVNDKDLRERIDKCNSYIGEITNQVYLRKIIKAIEIKQNQF